MVAERALHLPEHHRMYDIVLARLARHIDPLRELNHKGRSIRHAFGTDKCRKYDYGLAAVLLVA